MDEDQKRLRIAADQLSMLGIKRLLNIKSLLDPYSIPDITMRLKKLMIDSEDDVPYKFRTPMSQSVMNFLINQVNLSLIDNHENKNDIEREIERLLYFTSMVETGAKYDLKNSGNWTALEYRYDGKIYPNDMTGNTAFGYFGMAMGIPEQILLLGAGFYQIKTDFWNIWDVYKDDPKNGRDSVIAYLKSWNLQKVIDLSDNPRDPEYIKIGIAFYKSRH